MKTKMKTKADKKKEKAPTPEGGRQEGSVLPISSPRVRRDLRRRARKAPAPLRLWAIYKASRSGELLGDPIYFAASPQEALTAISRAIQLSHAAHFAAWCAAHSKDPSGFPSPSWEEYMSAVVCDESGSILSDSDLMAMTSVMIPASDVASLMRVAADISPLGLPSEPDEEIFSAAMVGDQNIPLIAEADPAAEARIGKICGSLGKGSPQA